MFGILEVFRKFYSFIPPFLAQLVPTFCGTLVAKHFSGVTRQFAFRQAARHAEQCYKRVSSKDQRTSRKNSGLFFNSVTNCPNLALSSCCFDYERKKKASLSNRGVVYNVLMVMRTEVTEGILDPSVKASGQI
jgi:hypothetical protein